MLCIRPFKPCDAAQVVTWIPDESTFLKWSAGRYPTYPITGEDMIAFYAREADNDGFWAMSAYDEEGLMGHFIMRYLEGDRRSIRLGYILLDPARRGKGYGKRMVRMAIRYAFEFLDAEQVSLGVFDNNPAAIHCYEAAGLRLNGVECDYTIQGEVWRCLDMVITRDQWQG